MNGHCSKLWYVLVDHFSACDATSDANISQLQVDHAIRARFSGDESVQPFDDVMTGSELSGPENSCEPTGLVTSYSGDSWPKKGTFWGREADIGFFSLPNRNGSPLPGFGPSR